MTGTSPLANYANAGLPSLEKRAGVPEIIGITPAPTAASARRAGRANVYEFKPHASRRARASVP